MNMAVDYTLIGADSLSRTPDRSHCSKRTFASSQWPGLEAAAAFVEAAAAFVEAGSLCSERDS
jgi:hypothetical protein